MLYRTILWDLDHTLLDSEASERLALAETLQSANVADQPSVATIYRRINGGLWARVETGELSPNEVKTLRFEQLVRECDLDADPLVMANSFAAGMGRFGDLYPGAQQALRSALDNSETMALVTNGVGDIQRARVARLGISSLFDALIISGEIGCSKPGAAIFDATFELLGVDPGGAVMIGDSISSDMRGGFDYGLDTIWFNRRGAAPPTEIAITHTVASLGQLASLLGPRPVN
ncbi:MAG: noncanonical pyrimidine nucleotidase, YjjG family [Actinobacteria bacterium]|nr:noncanonical pyrimidine nucleotidase, YjjG family [Actinomycetota bacterium]